MSQPVEITILLRAWGQGDQAALDRLTPLVYAELRAWLAALCGNERAGNTLQATALVNEAYLRLVGARAPAGRIGRISSPSRRRSCGGF